ncbi:GH36 C-terminal domain-containing protein [Devosia rhodophyticola]|uniref:GH36 C-terminal domain-containing protein n=1 Tax=Devosia rhodophyticola TaxID=3026423 RepID=A0ABY7Z396_9HYPH|nr:GH36 C-terminal domain-containing protein [Devosia rhodophyticola]WDR07569.1 GH36 C-terminal domain-containing protein [Devosia rhodophyticola]
MRPIVSEGDLYRLRSPRDSKISALAYVSKDKGEAVVFVYRLRPGRPTDAPVIGVTGLDPEARYESLDGGVIRSGRGWEQVGIKVSLGDDQSAVLRFSRRR